MTSMMTSLSWYRNITDNTVFEFVPVSELTVTYILLNMEDNDLYALTFLTLSIAGDVATPRMTLGRLDPIKRDHISMWIQLQPGVKYLMQKHGPNYLSVFGFYEPPAIAEEEVPLKKRARPGDPSNKKGKSRLRKPSAQNPTPDNTPPISTRQPSSATASPAPPNPDRWPNTQSNANPAFFSTTPGSNSQSNSTPSFFSMASVPFPGNNPSFTPVNTGWLSSASPSTNPSIPKPIPPPGHHTPVSWSMPPSQQQASPAPAYNASINPMNNRSSDGAAPVSSSVPTTHVLREQNTGEFTGGKSAEIPGVTPTMGFKPIPNRFGGAGFGVNPGPSSASGAGFGVNPGPSSASYAGFGANPGPASGTSFGFNPSAAGPSTPGAMYGTVPGRSAAF
ncbi:hypothetical protein F5890DRAFT_1558765, partial [Lentinula detonsa]